MDKSKTQSRLSATFKQLRRQMKMTQRELAEQTGINIKVIRSIEQNYNTVTLAKLEELLEFFGYQLMPIDRQHVEAVEEILADYAARSRGAD